VRDGDSIDNLTADIRDEDHEPVISDDGRVPFSTLDALFFGNQVIHRAGDPLDGLEVPLDLVDFGPAMNQNHDIAFLGHINGQGGPEFSISINDDLH
jgi:hypothetical protein